MDGESGQRLILFVWTGSGPPLRTNGFAVAEVTPGTWLVQTEESMQVGGLDWRYLRVPVQAEPLAAGLEVRRHATCVMTTDAITRSPTTAAGPAVDVAIKRDTGELSPETRAVERGVEETMGGVLRWLGSLGSG